MPAHDKPSLERHEALARDLVAAYNDGDVEALRRISARLQHDLDLDEFRAALRDNLRRAHGGDVDAASVSLADAQSVVARWDNFESWDALTNFVGRMQADATTAAFESAVNAVVDGDAATLDGLLRAHPGLARARSPRDHRATLLHYVSANGVEDFRQRSPSNSVEIATLLLSAGAEVDATLADGTSTTLGLVATSVHPAAAGVQIPLLETLLAAGAAIDGVPGGWSPVGAALPNGRGDAAAYLAERGARLDLESAAGAGRLELVQTFFDQRGKLSPNATKEQMVAGFTWACEFGRTAVVEFLLDHGVKVDTRVPHNGQTGLHWAAFGGHADTTKLLLARNAPVNAKDKSFDGTPLGWALYGWGTQPPEFRTGRYYDVVSLLVGAGATVDPAWLDESDRGAPLERTVREDPRMLAALGGQP